MTSMLLMSPAMFLQRALLYRLRPKPHHLAGEEAAVVAVAPAEAPHPVAVAEGEEAVVADTIRP
jgi:hypothetical protein